MRDILQDGSPARLIAAIEENMSSFLPVFGKLGNSYVDNPAGVKRSITNIPYTLLNSVMDARLAPEQLDAAIQSIMADARSRNVPLLWWTGPSTRPADLGKHLEKHGFIHDDEAPGMAVDLAKLNESLPFPEGLSFQLAQDDASWQQWSNTMALGFEIPSSADFVVAAWRNLLRLADPETTLAYIGRLNDKPVAISLLFLAAGVAGIYSVATIPEARRKGIGALITQYPLRQARSMGYHFGILQSSEMGLNVYRSLGFQEYCKINVYRWRS
jgi:GNAT superfamily N-acetyltransferase